MNFKIIIIILILSVYSCNKNKIENYDNIIGSWIEKSITDDTMIRYKRVNELKDNEYGFSFNLKGQFIERKNTINPVWCVNSPVSYENYVGTWERADSIINIEVAYWGGLVDYKWKIVFLDNNKLQIVKLKYEFHETE